ncbi:MAG: hypothetical protein AVDCRST_MAG54-4529, partial [uncultured Actinomycetospora sp.]
PRRGPGAPDARPPVARRSGRRHRRGRRRRRPRPGAHAPAARGRTRETRRSDGRL